MKAEKRKRTRQTARSKAKSIASVVADSVGQILFPGSPRDGSVQSDAAPEPPPPPAVVEARPHAHEVSAKAVAAMLCEVANCLWYLKTRHFKRAFHELDGDDEDPRVRRALGRIQRCLDSLAAGGVEIRDCAGEPYRGGSEAFLGPIQFQPTEGLTFERVGEMVQPVVFWNDIAIQRGEAFVDVPLP